MKILGQIKFEIFETVNGNWGTKKTQKKIQVNNKRE